MLREIVRRGVLGFPPLVPARRARLPQHWAPVLFHSCFDSSRSGRHGDNGLYRCWRPWPSCAVASARRHRCQQCFQSNAEHRLVLLGRHAATITPQLWKGRSRRSRMAGLCLRPCAAATPGRLHSTSYVATTCFYRHEQPFEQPPATTRRAQTARHRSSNVEPSARALGQDGGAIRSRAAAAARARG